MRIIAGAAKGRRLDAPRSGTRPFTGRAREAVFSSLYSRINGARVLDLFAGSGSLGLEALSRGADSVVFVEHDRAASAVLENNVEAVGLGGEVVRRDVDRFLTTHRGIYDLVFVDPPFALPHDEVERTLGRVEGLLDDRGTIVLHRRFGGSAPESDNLQCTDRRRYGDSEIWIFEKE